MAKKDGRKTNFLLIAGMVLAVALVTVLHDPVQILVGLLLGVVVLVVVFDGRPRRWLEKKIGSGVQAEIDAGQGYVADVPDEVLSLLKEGRKVDAIKCLHEHSDISLSEAARKMDEINLRLSMGQTVNSKPEQD
jgi:hypothetical protein